MVFTQRCLSSHLAVASLLDGDARQGAIDVHAAARPGGLAAAGALDLQPFHDAGLYQGRIGRVTGRVGNRYDVPVDYLVAHGACVSGRIG
jgi:hypothetical protein